jgi:signal transduction histidine kinase/CheY-like chemotaxis protein
MNSISKIKLIRHKKVYETLINLIGYEANDIDDFLHFLLKEVVKSTGSKKGFLFAIHNKSRSFELSYSIDLYENIRSGDDHKKVYELTDAGPWLKAYELEKPIIQNFKTKLLPVAENSHLCEAASGFCSFSVTISNSSTVVLVITDKENEYDIDDTDYMESLIKPVKDIVEKIRRIEDLKALKDKAERNEQYNIFYQTNIWHEIRTPVNAIAGFSQLLKEDDQSPANRQKFLDIILESSNELVSIINNVLEISNIESGLIKISEEEVLLSGVFSELLEQFKKEASRKNIVLQTHLNISDGDIKILADRSRLIQLLSALLSNSFKFTFTGKIEFGCKLQNEFLEFFVSDTGIGISQKDMDKVFNRFFQSDDSILKSFKGIGLGLIISKALAEKMGGEMWCDSVEGKGSLFYFTLPYVPAMTSQTSMLPSVKNDSEKEQGKKIILVAEDDNVNFMLIQNFLTGLDVVLLRAENGKEAVDICFSNDVDLVLMDIKMPVMDGYTAIRIIRESNPDLVIIAQTAFAGDRELVLESGCNDFIAKPFGKAQLRDLVNSYILSGMIK